MDLKSIFTDKFVNTDQYDSCADYTDSSSASGQKDVEVGDGSNFTAGESVIIYDGEDTFETAVIDSISSNTLTMTENLTNTYVEGSYIGKYLGYLDTANYKYQRMVAPDLGDGSDGAYVSAGNDTWDADKNYTSILIDNGDEITIEGDIDIKCQGTINITDSKITAKGQGYGGGNGGQFYGYQGDSELGAGAQGNGANGSGGGGTDCSGYSTSIAGGGGGGYGTAGSPGPAGTSCNSGGPGVGGELKNDASLGDTFTEEYLKGGGGGGGKAASNGTYAGDGGDGGGIIKLHCKNLIIDSSNGEIDCDGNDGGDASTPIQYNASGGGGGAGGTIFIQCLNNCSIETETIHANGGAGGIGADTGGPNSGNSYIGGAGANGRIRIEASKLTGTSSPTYADGYNNDVGGYTRYGWYHTKRIEPLAISTVVQCVVTQELVAGDDVAGATASGQKDVEVDDASYLTAGARVLIYEDSKFEVLTIDSVSTNTLTMTTNLVNSYTSDADVLRLDAFAYASLEPDGDDENQEEMGLVNVESIGSSLYNLYFQKIFKTSADGIDRTFIVGRVKLVGADNNSFDVNIREVDWFYY